MGWMEIKCISCFIVLAKTPKYLVFNNVKTPNKLTLKAQPIFCFNCCHLRESGIE